MNTTAKVQNKGQVTIPTSVRRQAGLSKGDLVSFDFQQGKIVITPKVVIDRIPADKAERRKFFQQLRDNAPDWLKASWEDAKRTGTDKLTMRQINSIIERARKERTAAKKIKPPSR
jgi:AbrB family looped-hinge helix DNA binding protein